MKINTIAIIGAGIGGIAVAARLAKNGYRVILLEKNSRPGGRTDILEKNGFRFDTGPTLFLMPEVFEETYRAIGENIADHLELIRVDPTYRVHFNDNTYLDITADLGIMRKQLETIEPGSFQEFLGFIKEGSIHYNVSLKSFVGKNFTSWFQYLSPANIPLLFRVKALKKHYRNTSRYFRDPRLRAAFSFQNMYLGVSPYDAMATYSLLQYSEVADGVWFPKGGMYKVIESMVSIAQNLGVEFRYDNPVTEIDVDDSKARGVKLADGGSLKADIIIANADLPYVYSELLPDDGISARLDKKKYSSSAIMFYWGIKGIHYPQLLHHNVFLADHKYRESFDKIFRDLTLPDDLSFYVCAPSRTDPGFAMSDTDSLLVLVPVGHLNDKNPQDWQKLKGLAKKAVLARLGKLGISDLENRIIFEEAIGPEEYRNSLNLWKGAAFGLSHSFLQVGYMRPRNRHHRYKNLYFVGASTHPGTGLPIVLLSARLVMERILMEQ